MSSKSLYTGSNLAGRSCFVFFFALSHKKLIRPLFFVCLFMINSLYGSINPDQECQKQSPYSSKSKYGLSLHSLLLLIKMHQMIDNSLIFSLHDSFFLVFLIFLSIITFNVAVSNIYGCHCHCRIVVFHGSW